MKQHKIRESYLYPALVAFGIAMRGRWSNWTFTVKRKDDTMDYHELYGNIKSNYRNTVLNKTIKEIQLKEITELAHYWVAAYEWGYQQGKEDNTPINEE